MIDAAILPLQRRLMQTPAEALVRRGVRADQITIAGLVIGLAAAGAAALGMFTLALGGLLLNRLADGLDGAVARLTQPTDRGAFFSISRSISCSTPPSRLASLWWTRARTPCPPPCFWRVSSSPARPFWRFRSSPTGAG